jgi:flagellin
MISILNNPGAMVALQALNATQSALATTQNDISTGLKINSAKDNAATWTVATTMQANVASLNQVSSDLGNADSILGTAVSGAGQITSLVSQIRAQIASFTDTATNQTATQSNVTQLAAQINSTVTSSSFNGVDLLDGSHANGLTFVAATNNSYTGGGASPTISTGNSVDLSSASANATVSAFTTLVSNLATAITGATPAAQQTALDSALQTVDQYNALVQSQAAQFGSVQSSVEQQQTFVNNLANTFQTGAGNMVDANMTAESAQLSALQVQQQLGTQALSIANQAPQMILKLFGG